MPLKISGRQLPEGWTEKKIGDIALLSRGQNPPKSKFVNSPQEGYVRFYQIRDGKSDDYEVYVPDTPQLHKVEPDDILMVAYRHIGRVFRGANGAFNVALCKIKNKDRSVLHDDYLFYIIPTEFVRGELMKQAERSLIPSMSVKHLAEIKIPVPPLSEQKRIVSIVDEAFEGIDRAIANTQKNLANARELFESYLNAIFTQKGNGWIEKKLEDLCSITSKLVDPRQSEFLDLPHVGAGNMIPLTGELIEVKTAREEELKSGKFLFDETMVLYSKIRPYLMKACRPDFKGLCSADVYPLLPNDGQLHRDFLFHLLMSRDFTNYAISGSDRAGMPKVNRDHLFRYVIWVPSLSEQIKLAKNIDEIAAETQRLEAIYQQKLAALTELKQAILQKAVTGELTANTANQATKTAKEVIAA